MIENNEDQIEKIFNDNLSTLGPEDKAKFLKSWNLLDAAVKKSIKPSQELVAKGGKRTRRKGRKHRKHRK